MKLPQLLSQFLYQTRRLDLPGIGTFTLDPTVVIPLESDRNTHPSATGIQFKNVNISVPDDALVSFIKEHTGKMKSLAASDLDFFLTTGRQLLNIGKPFYIEGVGTLLKNKEGQLDFAPGEYMIARLDETGTEKKNSSFEDSSREHDTRDTRSSGNGVRQALVLLGLVGGLVIVGWGGYHLYRKNNFVEPAAQAPVAVLPDSTSARPDATSSAQPAADTAATRPVDTLSHKPPPVTQPPATAVQPPPVVPQSPSTNLPVPEGSSLYRFVILRTSNKDRALRRYNQLLGYQLNIKMDQKDSSYFKLYFPIAAAIRDTTHIRDSLAFVYAARITIEQ